jgi:hypothetical protein
MVGLGSVDNTSDLNKPVSTAAQSALDLKAPLASPTFTGTVSGIDKTMVGLGSVDNTSDLSKPVSTAAQSALDLKANLTSAVLVTPNLGTPSAGILTNCTFPTLNQNTTGTSSNVTGIVLGANGGTGVANTGKTITLGGNLTTIGAFATTFTSTAATSVTLPTAGTLSTLAGTETLSNKTLVTPALGTPASGVMTNVTGTAAGLTAGNVTTNANLTGHITSVGNAAVLGSFTSAQLATALTDETGTGANVFATSPTLVTPNIGVASGTSFNSITALSSTSPAMDGTATIGTGTTVARADHIHPIDTSRAPLASPTFTGTPTAPTATAGTNTTQLATTAFVVSIVGIQGVDAGGTAGQLLSKIDGTDYNTQWIDAPASTNHQLNQLIGVI